MKTLPRLTRFALVGALGVAVQLAALALFNRWLHGRYLVASAAAIELAVLHNFVWHLRYTWRDRRHAATSMQQLVRFHLSNGLVSLAGSLALMRLLVQTAHLPLLAANILAIAACGAANFALADLWSFTRGIPAKSLLACMLLAMSATACRAQTATQSGTTPADYGIDSFYANTFVGPVLPAGVSGHSPSFTAGFTFGMYDAQPPGKKSIFSPQFELGIVGPLPGGHPLDGLASVDWMYARKLRGRNLYPNLTAGYTRMFVTGNAVNFGIGVDFNRNDWKHIYRVELRDYYLFTGPQQHVIGLRIARGSLIDD